MHGQTSPTPKKLPPGLSYRHGRNCGSKTGGTCNCIPAIRAFVYDPRKEVRRRDGTVTYGGIERKTFTGKGAAVAAKRWRTDALSQLNHGTYVGPSAKTLNEIADEWLAGAEAQPPTVLTKGGAPYKPSVLREYRRTLKTYMLDDLGAHRLSDIRRGDLQALIDRLIGQGLSASTVGNVLMPIRVLYRHALQRDLVANNPTANLRLPSGDKPRERAASATEAADLIAALPQADRALWATAFYAGLRRGELRAIRWEDIDLANGKIHVKRGWDDVAGEIAPKSASGTRTVPVVALLRDHLVEAKTRTGRDGNDFVFGPKADRPFTASNIRKRAANAWADANKKRQEDKLEPLIPIALHEARHSFVSLMHDAGFSLEEIAPYAGHSSSYMTERYKHLIEGHEARAAARLDAYFALADTAARVAQIQVD